MYKSVDRILVAVKDLYDAEQNFRNVLAAEPVDEFESAHLNARVRKLAIGRSFVELCTPLGSGPVEERLVNYGEGLVAGGVTTDDLDDHARHLEEKGVRFAKADDRLYLSSTDLYGLPLVVSRCDATSIKRMPGPVDFLYEITMVLSSSWRTVADSYADKLGLARDKAVDITFERFGYDGTLLMFEPGKLDRIELAEAHDPAFAMGRFAKKRNDALYMCYIETDDLADIIARLERHGHKWTRRTDTPGRELDGLWIHPSALNGVLLGVSRTSLAWRWSGCPELVTPVEVA